MFPELHETFILRELVALEKRGLLFDIYSLQFPRDPITIDDAIRLSEERTSYAKLISFQSLSAFAQMLFTKPVKTIGAIGKVIWHGRDRPADVIKNLAVLPLTLQFYHMGSKRGIKHWHGHWANIPTTACWYLQQIHGVSWSAAIHGEDIFSANKFLSYKLDDAAFSVVCSGYFCNHLKTELGLRQPDDIYLNYHGLDPRVMERSSDRAFNARAKNEKLKLVSIGRLVPTKGHDVLIKACSLLKNGHNIELDLQLIGSGPIEEELKILAQSENVADMVQFRGGLAFEDVLSTLEQADMFCLAPRFIPGHPPDGIPNVIAEAMALRVPVVSTRVSAIPELLETGKTGQLVEVDDVQGFANAMLQLANDEALAKSISDAGFVKVGQLFDQQKNIDELIALFERYVPGKVV
jgi:glycosyltransferase involved in cell wall biosynthesis